MHTPKDTTTYLSGAIAIVGIIASSYFSLQNTDLKNEITALTQDRNELLQDNNTKTAQLNVSSTTITELTAELDNIKDDLDDLADDYRDEQNRNEDFEDQIRSLSGTLGDLDKLANTDKQLLAKYSKVYFLNENYTPERVKQIADKYILKGKSDQYFHASAIDHLEDMFEDAADDDIDLKVVSAYRSFDEQSSLKGQYTQVYGTGANTFSADQGYSEHQLGTTLDITVDAIGGTYDSFATTDAFTWLEKNAYKYGFILSYPEDNTFYVYEPWHWRFVGVDLAKDLDRKNKTFYELDQRDIDEYLITLFD